MNANSSSFGSGAEERSPKPCRSTSRPSRPQRGAERGRGMCFGHRADLELEQRVAPPLSVAARAQRGAERLQREPGLLLQPRKRVEQRRGEHAAEVGDDGLGSRCAAQHVVAADALAALHAPAEEGAVEPQRPRSSVVPQIASPAARCGYSSVARHHSSRPARRWRPSPS